MAGPLEGYRVVELGEGVAAPYCAMELGDAGAGVIKIEPAAGDCARNWGPPMEGSFSSVFLRLNRSKRGIALDLDAGDGVEVAYRLLQTADVVVVDLNRLPHPSLRYEAIAATNPNIVYCAISGFGDRGPWADRPGGELPVQLLTEATSSLGRIGDPPVRVGNDIASMYAAIHGVQAICAALLARDRIGSGQRIDVSLFGSLLAMRSTLWVALSNPDEWWGFHLDSYVKPPDHGYPCRDGRIFVNLARMDAAEFDTLLAELDMDWVRDEPLFELLAQDSTGGGRYAHVVHHLWDRALERHTVAQAMAIIERHGGLAFPMNDYQMIENNEQVRAVGMIQTMEQPGAGLIKVMTPPWDFEDTPWQLSLPAPRLGEHSIDILREAGYPGDDIDRLIQNGSVVANLETA
jgi:crotonobetainyl-CoA:carnitine CoA-transferase CaiB-like acyl-CoA transferase